LPEAPSTVDAGLLSIHEDQMVCPILGICLTIPALFKKKKNRKHQKTKSLPKKVREK
jgi:hypothetical protein